ncbi:hypothetical protein F4801DRAFT_527605 [Xylaria longipes]|nr:hypothetical protein F4801DRAFT_527605 [Xylaria longipes]
MANPMQQEERENLARTIGSIWETLATPTNTTPSTATPSTATPSVATSDSSAPTSATSTNSEQPHIDIRHDTCLVNMSVNTDAVAAELSRRDDRHEERIPCRNRERAERGPKVEQEGPNYVFGDAARQQRPQSTVQMHYSNSSTTIRMRDITSRPMGLNIGVYGRSVGAHRGSQTGVGYGHVLVTFKPSDLVVALCVILALWFLKK